MLEVELSELLSKLYLFRKISKIDWRANIKTENALNLLNHIYVVTTLLKMRKKHILRFYEFLFGPQN